MYIPGVLYLGHMVYLFLDFWEVPRLLSTVVALFLFPPITCEDSLFSISPTYFNVIYSLDGSHLIGVMLNLPQFSSAFPRWLKGVEHFLKIMFLFILWGFYTIYFDCIHYYSALLILWKYPKINLSFLTYREKT